MFYIVCRSLEERARLIAYLKEHDILSVFHYLSLHKSDFYVKHSEAIPELSLCDMYADCLLRLPMFYELTLEQVDGIVNNVNAFFNDKQK
jgi:dTDP-4-amino-4,6-dideoxygalactose transaminase